MRNTQIGYGQINAGRRSPPKPEQIHIAGVQTGGMSMQEIILGLRHKKQFGNSKTSGEAKLIAKKLGIKYKELQPL